MKWLLPAFLVVVIFITILFEYGCSQPTNQKVDAKFGLVYDYWKNNIHYLVFKSFTNDGGVYVVNYTKDSLSTLHLLDSAISTQLEKDSQLFLQSSYIVDTCLCDECQLNE